MIRAAVCGAGGKMGLRVIHFIKEEKDVVIGALIEKKGSPFIGQEIVPGIKVEAGIENRLDKFDVLIDFTSPAGSLENVKLLSKHSKSAVIGTTGLSQKEVDVIKECGKTMRVVFSPNMSTGVNVLLSIVGRAAELLKDYDIEIVETHHNKKKDAPSGTALKIAETITGALNLDLNKSAVYGRFGADVRRGEREIGIHSVRAGDIVGEHSVYFAGFGECIELKHTAYTRDAFAKGAIKAAKWVAGRANGFYTMQDVLGIS